MSIEENKAITHRFYENWNKGNMEGVYALFASDIVDHNPGPGQAAGIEGLKQALDLFKNAFPDSQLKLEHLIAEGDKIVDHGTFRGTHTGEMVGIPPTGKPVSITFTNIYRIANGKIVEAWHIEDILGIMQQIGVMPMPGQAPQA